MQISDVLKKKGTGVVTVTPDSSVRDLLAQLAEHRIGAIVVSLDGEHVDGIVSERDVVRRLHSDGAGVLSQPVSAIMTAQVITSAPDEDLEGLARTMTDNRIRHVPIVSGDKLYAIVSIGDIVKHRIDALQDERDQLMAYIQQ